MESGRRISAICQLRHGDLLLGRGRCGMIRWRAETDKSGRESVVPISPRLRGVLDRLLARRPGIGEAPLFPAPGDPSKPVSRRVYQQADPDTMFEVVVGGGELREASG